MSLSPTRGYEESCRLFRWHIPGLCNAAVEAIDRQATGSADAHRTALITESDAGLVNRYTFLDLMHYSNRLAHVLTARGMGAGDRVGLVMAPSGEAAVALLGVLKIGAVAVPLPAEPDPKATLERLAAARVAAVIGDRNAAALVARAATELPDLKLAMAAQSWIEGVAEMWTSLIEASPEFEAAQTADTDPALLLPFPAGPCLFPHRILRARAAGAEYAFQNFPHVGDVMWSATDWASDGGWIDAVLPAWYHGVPVVATPHRLGDLPGLLTRWGVRNVHLPARHLNLLKTAVGKQRTPLRSLVVTGTPSPVDAGWLKKRFGAALVGTFAPDPFGPVIAPSPALGFTTPEGAWGRPAPGYVVDVVDDSGRILAAGEIGEVAMLAESPTMPLDFIGLPPTIGHWQTLGAKGRKDLEGIFWPDPPVPTPIVPQAEAKIRVRLGVPDPSDRWRQR